MAAASAPSVSDVRDIGEAEFQAIRRLVYEHFGISLSDQKRSLVVGRLQKVLRQRRLPDFRSYLEWLQADQSGEALQELANRISTNHTFFWRENSHFSHFASTALPEFVERHRRTGGNLRFWCAGCSTGEEPYTLVMLMKEVFGPEYRAHQPLLLATDLSANALRIAMRGVYSNERLEQMPPHLRGKYFRRGPEAGTWQVVDDVRREVVYRRHNLMDSRYPFTKPLDAVFCRNVMIYFDKETRDALIARFHRHTAKGGYLYVGHSETLTRDNALFEYVLPAAYRRI
ncbi:MAG: protein-glutamate O-methyltransferase CheR [Candidatus Krumholzibacteria bacterium]|jgi:chemotaxis protein methyltransferase CheR|nr:protein-glutamate O-methyltransferase CheR [Candidatus Krumholzibacteria bacterium]